MGGLVLLLVAVAYGAFSRRLDRLWISAPMVFVAAGLAMGPEELTCSMWTATATWCCPSPS